MAERQARRGYLETEEVEIMGLVTEVELLRAHSINALVEVAHQNAIEKGWHSQARSFGDFIALMHSELSEALEEYRNSRHFVETYYDGPDEKPCGIPIELADVIIRIFDACGKYGINIERAIEEKMSFNAMRTMRHGGKQI